MTEYATPWRLDDAITAARAGQREQAQLLLQRIVEDDPSNVDAWLWLGGVEVDPAAQYRALERVVALEPGNERALHGLAWLDKQYPHLSLSPVADVEPVPVADASTATNDEADLSLDEPVRPIGADPDLRCPYCGEWTNISDTACARCQFPLIAETGGNVGSAFARWLLALVWLLLAAGTGVVAYLAYDEVGRIQAGTSRIGASLVALGGAPPLGNALSPAFLLQLANGMVVASVVLTVLGILFVLGMLLRWRATYVLQIIALLLLIAGAGALIAAFWYGGRVELNLTQGYNADTLIMWAFTPALVVFVLLFLLTLGARREFFPRRERVRIPDERLNAGQHYKRGKRYQRNGWLWASAREYERALEHKPNNKRYNRALADVYAAMGDDAVETGEVMERRGDDLSLASNERG